MVKNGQNLSELQCKHAGFILFRVAAIYIFYLPFDLLAEVLLLCKKDYQRSLVSFVKDAKKQMLPAVLTL